KPAQAVTEFEKKLLCNGWLTLNHKKLQDSTADYWVLVVVSPEHINSPQFIVIPPAQLLHKLESTYGVQKSYAVYPWIMKTDIALNGRGLRKNQKLQLARGNLKLGDRDLTKYLADWSCLAKLQLN